MKLEYPFTIEDRDSDGWLVVQFLDFEEAFTQGKTVEECYFNAQEVLSLVIEQRMANGLNIPPPSASDSPHRTTPDAQTQAALLVHPARGERSQGRLEPHVLRRSASRTPGAGPR